MLLDRFEQQPNESRVRQIDFSARLLDGETISTVTATAALHSGSADDSGNPFAVTGATVENGTHVRYIAYGGASGNSYKLTFTTTTNTPQTREDEIIIRVREI